MRGGGEGSRRSHFFLGYREGLVSYLAVEFIPLNEKHKEKEGAWHWTNDRKGGKALKVPLCN